MNISKEILFQDVENMTIFEYDNLPVMQKMNDGVIDLIYLDPPFGNMQTWEATNKEKITKIRDYFLEMQKKNSFFPNEDFDEIFKDVKFDDTWEETDVNKSWQEAIKEHDEKLFDFIDSIDFVIKGGKYYLFYMAIRLIEMKRILKDTGSIYLHCDNTMGQYLKGVMDIIFGYDNFRNEIVWHYRRWTAESKIFQKLHDTLFFYVKNINQYHFNQMYTDYTEGSKSRKKQGVLNRFSNGEKYTVSDKSLNEKGVRENDVWHIPYIAPSSKERTGYRTQKPLALLDRIIQASSNKGDIVLDPFCGCATTLISSQFLDRKWIGIDKNKPAFFMNFYRMRNKLETIVETKNIQENLFGDDYETLKEKKDITPILINNLKEPRRHLPKLDDEAKDKIIDKQIAKNEKLDEEYKKYLERHAEVLKGEDKKKYREELRSEQNNTCKICKNKLYDSFHLDRIVSGADGGEYEESNLQVLCMSCNLSKNRNTNIFLIKKLFREKKIDKDVFRLNVEREFTEGRISEEEKKKLV